MKKILVFILFIFSLTAVSFADDSFTVNIQNTDGTYKPIIITKQGDTYIGPGGEHFNHFPTVAELQALYNGGTMSSPVNAVPAPGYPNMQAAVQREQMLRDQMQASADEEQSRIDAANKKLADQVAANNQMAQQQQAAQTNPQNQPQAGSTGGGIMGLIFFLLVLAGVAVWWGIGIFNSLVLAKQNVEQSLSQITVLLKRRHDLIPNLVEATKGYMGYEKDTLEKVTKARQAAVSATNVQDQIQAENSLSSVMRGFYAVAENYPDLKADQNVLQLQEQLTDTENKISVGRQQYNIEVKSMNVLVQSFPDSVVANIGHFEKAPFFKEESAEEIKVPQVNLKS